MRRYQPNTADRSSVRGGFTLVELLVVIGIIVILTGLLLVAVNLSRTKARKARVTADMQTIAVALEAYKQDFGDYPRLDYGTGVPVVQAPKGPPALPNLLTDFGANPGYIAGSELLGWALIGPYDAVSQTTPASNWLRGDGKAGMGFRVGTNARGTVYGPYLDVENFLRVPIPDPITNPLDRYYPYLQDMFRQPILYYARATNAANNNPTSLYNFNDNGIAFVRSVDSYPPTRPVPRFNAILNRDNPNGPYLLWSAGPDEQFSVDDPTDPAKVQKCDDILFSGGQ